MGCPGAIDEDAPGQSRRRRLHGRVIALHVAIPRSESVDRAEAIVVGLQRRPHLRPDVLASLDDGLDDLLGGGVGISDEIENHG